MPEGVAADVDAGTVGILLFSLPRTVTVTETIDLLEFSNYGWESRDFGHYGTDGCGDINRH